MYFASRFFLTIAYIETFVLRLCNYGYFLLFLLEYLERLEPWVGLPFKNLVPVTSRRLEKCSRLLMETTS